MTVKPTTLRNNTPQVVSDTLQILGTANPRFTVTDFVILNRTRVKIYRGQLLVLHLENFVTNKTRVKRYFTDIHMSYTLVKYRYKCNIIMFLFGSSSVCRLVLVTNRTFRRYYPGKQRIPHIKTSKTQAYHSIHEGLLVYYYF